MPEPDKTAAYELIPKLRAISAFGTATGMLESDTETAPHEHVPDRHNAAEKGFAPDLVIEICKECGEVLSEPYKLNPWRGMLYNERNSRV